MTGAEAGLFWGEEKAVVISTELPELTCGVKSCVWQPWVAGLVGCSVGESPAVAKAVWVIE